VRFIYFGNGKWDLPKGGIEKGRIEDTAMREVEEETGVNQLRVTKLQKRIILSVTGSTSLKSPIGLKWSLVLRCAPRSVRRGIEK
jgi:8-oxo-dGTP pyrophosphatase MutT (NUDIX family)